MRRRQREDRSWISDGNDSQPVAVVGQGGTSHVRHGCTSQPVAAASHDDAFLAQYLALCDWVGSVSNGHWRHILKSHFQRRKTDGGPICTEHTKDVAKKEKANDGSTKTTITFPNSFDHGDGLQCSASGVDEEQACKTLFLKLLVRDAIDNYPNCKMVLKQQNWTIPVDHFLLEIARNASPLYAEGLPMEFVDPSSGPSSRRLYEEPDNQQSRDIEVVELLKEISFNENGWARPNYLKRICTTREGVKMTPWCELSRLLKPHALLPFLRRHPGLFEVNACGTQLYAFRCIADHSPGQPVALVEENPCTCGMCEIEWFTTGWSCPGSS